MNLLLNAIQAITGKGEIRVRTCLEGPHVRVSIADSGTGIKAENLEKIFDPGFTTKGVGVGTGLGLSISARIIEDHRGTITVQSEVGKGTTFVVSLPLQGVPKPAQAVTARA
jgi:signal transduction histidine kinase